MTLPKIWQNMPDAIKEAFEIQKLIKSGKLGSNMLRIPAEILRIITGTGWNGALGQDILDIGGGSTHNNPDQAILQNAGIVESGSDVYEPWYARTAHRAGANVVCLDIGDNPQEEFETITADLSNPYNLVEAVHGRVFDVINNYYFTLPQGGKHWQQRLMSPYLMHQIAYQKKWNVGNLLAHIWNRDKSFHEHDALLSTQVCKILREGGRYIHAEFVYEKRNNKLMKLGTMQGLGS